MHPTAKMSAILVVNVGSGSVKTALFSCEPEPRELGRAGAPATTAADAVSRALELAATLPGNRHVRAVGHRLVHGGATYQSPTRLTPAVLGGLRQLVPFAPNHLPAALAVVDAFASAHPDAVPIGCFDTAFHATLPDVARRLPIPARYDARGIRRYGFHGLSCASVIDALRRGPSPDRASQRLVIAHLGNGCSLTATRDGVSVDTTMGFTPVGGVMMATRSGDLDPGAMAFIARADRLDADALEQVLSVESGLLGVAGTTGDMKMLLARAASDPASRLAVDMFVFQVAKAVAALAASLGGIDGLVFTGGIGEHAGEIRDQVCARLGFLRIAWVEVVPADEELVIARAARTLLEGSV